MRQRLIQREQPRLLVGDLAVTASRGAMRQLERLGGAETPAMERVLLAELEELICLPRATDVVPRDTDLAFDLVVQGYRFGSATDFAIGPIPIPLWWRPKVRLEAQLFHLQSRKAKAALHVVEAMPWAVFAGRAVSWQVLLGLQAPARPTDMGLLLRKAAERLLSQLRAAA